MNQSEMLVYLLGECRRVYPGAVVRLLPRLTPLGFSSIRLMKQEDTILAEVYDDGAVFLSSALEVYPSGALVAQAGDYLDEMQGELFAMERSLTLLQMSQLALQQTLRSSLTVDGSQEGYGL